MNLNCINLLVVSLALTGCSTVVAVADITASTVIYAGKTVVNTIDAITPDIINHAQTD